MPNNTFFPTSFTVSSTFATLASYLASAGFPDIVNNPIASQNGYIRNQDATINLHIGFGTTAPTSYEIVAPKDAIQFDTGLNANLIWIRSASSTVVAGFAEGSASYIPATVGGSFGSITATSGTFSGLITTATGTTALANINTPAGVLKTTTVAGDHEFDGANSYITNEATAGRGSVYVDQYFRLTATGSTISTIANYFGANSNIVLVSGGFYEIDIYAWFLKSTAGTVVWTFTNSAAPTAQDIYYEMSPVTGIVAPPGTATMLIGQIYNDATAAKALTATGALSDTANHYMHTKIWLQNSTGTSFKIQATVSAGTITPGIGSRWFCRRLPAANAGLFAA